MAKFHLQQKVEGQVISDLACNGNPNTRGRVLALTVFLMQLERTPTEACKKCTQLAYEQHQQVRDARKNREDANRREIANAMRDAGFTHVRNIPVEDSAEIFAMWHWAGIKVMIQFTPLSTEEDRGYKVRSWYSANATDLDGTEENIDRVLGAVLTDYQERKASKKRMAAAIARRTGTFTINGTAAR